MTRIDKEALKAKKEPQRSTLNKAKDKVILKAFGVK